MTEAELRKEDLSVRHIHAYVETFCRHTSHPIAVTIQPNFAHEGGGKTLHSSAGLERLEVLVKELFYRLDRGYSGCVKPHYLPRQWRFNGIVLPEGYETNPHVHVILSCPSQLEQTWRYWFLLWALDNSPAKLNPNSRAADRYNEDCAWRILSRRSRPWMAWNDAYGQGAYLTGSTFGRERLAPAGTAKVQLVESVQDLEAVLVYDTKDWMRRMKKLTYSPSARAHDKEYEFWRLSEYFSRAAENNPARCYRIDPNNPDARLPSKGCREWRLRNGRVIR